MHSLETNHIPPYANPMSCIKDTTRGCCFSADPAAGELSAVNCPGCHKLEVFDWMSDLPDPLAEHKIFEVQFKNTHKGFYQNDTGGDLKVGDIVAVESSPGHDIGIVSMGGGLVARQMRRTGFNPRGAEFPKIYRKAKPGDIEKWQEAIALEHQTMIRSRQIAASLGLNMKIGDVEYQADRAKAIFYYIADERVDFRQLIKVLAEQFRIRVEMRQIGARQEAGRIGGIAACGRELCCSTWINHFASVTIGAARHQEISLNPQKLAGQCGKLKCCLNYELDSYIDARRSMPKVNAPLEALDGSYHLVKTDIFNGVMWFSPDAHSAAIQIPVSVERVKKIQAMNKRGEKIDTIADSSIERPVAAEEPQLLNVVGEESITRFDKSGKGSGRSRRGGRNRGGGSSDAKPAGAPDASGRNNASPGRNASSGRGRHAPSEKNASQERSSAPGSSGGEQQGGSENRNRSRSRGGRNRGRGGRGGQGGGSPQGGAQGGQSQG